MFSSPGDGDAVPASGLPRGAAVGVAGDAVVSRLIWVLWHGFSNSDERVATAMLEYRDTQHSNPPDTRNRRSCSGDCWRPDLYH